DLYTREEMTDRSGSPDAHCSGAKYGLVAEIATMARTYLKRRLIFDRCVDFLIGRRVQVPGHCVAECASIHRM
ncbi:hypothetical protein, partial [Roseibium sp. RKSG952]|uniref:hypothetical protein n=1 Tax=Roseibium sp. RKSG952 TaxID=2529384 RepID=UPI001AD90792